MRWRLVVSLTAFSLAAWSSASHAEDTSEPRWYFGARFGAAFMLDGEPASDVEIARLIPVSGIFAGLNLNRYLGLELAGDMLEASLKTGIRRTVGEYGMFSLIPQVRLRYPLLDDRLTPYLIGGIGVGHHEFNDRKPRGLGATVRAGGTGVVGSVGGGVDYFVADNIAVGLETKLLLSTDQDIEIDEQGGTATLAALLTSAHLRLIFPPRLARAPLPQHPGWRLYIGIRIGGAAVLDTEGSPAVDIRPENAAIASELNHSFNVAVGVDLGRYTGIELAGDSYEPQLAVRPFGVIGEYAIYAVIPQLRLRYPLADGRVTPYLLTGVGLSWAQVNDRKPAGFDLKIERDSQALAASIGAGIDYFLARNIAVGLETKLLTSRDHRITVEGRSRYVSLDSLLISLGTRVFLR
jgi:opacity protein-like surface antigen